MTEVTERITLTVAYWARRRCVTRGELECADDRVPTKESLSRFWQDEFPLVPALDDQPQWWWVPQASLSLSLSLSPPPPPSLALLLPPSLSTVGAYALMQGSRIQPRGRRDASTPTPTWSVATGCTRASLGVAVSAVNSYSFTNLVRAYVAL